MTTLKSKIAKAGLGLVAAVGMLAGATSALAYTYTAPNLMVGSRGAAVSALQTQLGVTPVSGYFGPLTKAAVMAYQTAHNISPVSGLVGPLTRAVLNAGGTTGGTTSTVPGCTSTSGFSPTTGQSCSGSTTGNQTGPVTAMLSTDNPAAGYVINGQATADLAHFTFSGSGVVTSMTLTRGGISDQNTLTNVYLYQGNTRLTDGYSFNNTGVLTINGLNLAVNGSTTVSVKADASATASNSSTINVALTGFTASGTATTVNVKGNDMYLGAGTLAAVNMPTQASVAVPNASVNAGTSSYTVWSAPLQVNTRTVWLKGANFRMVGSAPAGALSNIRLYVDGVATGNAANVTAVNGSNYAMFDFTAMPVSLITGSHTVDVRADVVSGSSYTVQVSLQQAADLVLYDGQLNVNIAPTGPTTAGFTANNAGTITINAGSASVVVDPTFSAMTTITGGATNIAIAKFKVHGYGEDVKVSSLSVTPVLGSMTPTAAGLNNVAVYFNGSQVGSSQNWTSGALTFNLGSQMILPAGADSSIEIRADLQTTANANYTAGTVAATLSVGSSNGQGQTSHTTLNFPASTVVGTTLTVQTGLLAVSKNSSYTNQVVNPNAAGVKIGSFNLQNQSTSESVHVTGLNFALAFAVPTYTSGTLATGTQTWTVNSTTGMTVGNVIQPSTVVGGGTSVMTVTSVASATTVTGTVVCTGTCTSVAGGTTIIGSGTTSLAALTNFSNLKTTETSGSGANPILPTASNNFSVDFVLAPGATKTIDLLSDTSTANFGAVTATLTVTSLGMNSHVSISQTGSGVGQTITLGAGAVNTPTVVTSTTTQAQFVAGGTTTGATDATKATFNVTATNGSAVISELKFANLTGTSGALTSVRVGSSTAPMVGDIAYLTGLAISVPNGGAGVNVDAYASYAPVGSTGIASGATALLKLCSVKYTIGGTTTTVGDTSCASPLLSSGQTMTLVGSKPTVTVVQPAGVVLTTGAVEAIDVTVTADAAGPITVNSFAAVSTLTAGAGTPLFTAGAITVKDGSNNTVALATPSSGINQCTSAATCTVQVTFASGYLLSAGTSQTFKVFLPVAALGTGTLPNTYMNTNLPTGGTNFNWTDTAGSASAAQTSTANIYNYPSTFTSSIHN